MTDPQSRPDQAEESLTIRQAADLAGVHPVTIHRAIDAGEIALLSEGTRGFKVGHRVSRGAILEWVAARAKEHEEQAARLRAIGEPPPPE